MKINHATTPVTSANQRANATRHDPGATSSTAASTTPELQSRGLEKSLADASDVDMARVNALRQAIAEGQLDLDPAVLAEAVLDLHGS